MKNSPKQVEYWTDRAHKYEQQAYDATSKRIDRINAAYLEAQNYLTGEVKNIYQRYFNKPDELKRFIDSAIPPADLVALKAYAQKVKDTEDREKVIQFLNQVAASQRISRLEELKLKAYIAAKYAGATEKVEHKKLYSEIVKSAWDQAEKEGQEYQARKEYELPAQAIARSQKEGSTIAFKGSQKETTTTVNLTNKTPIKAVKEVPAEYAAEVASRKWDGSNYSSRIWKNTDELAKRLGQLFTAKELTSMQELDMARKIAEEFGTSMFNAKRLIRTESAYVVNQVRIDRWKARGVKEYQFKAVIDNRTSKICREMNDKVFEVAKAKPGVNLPPMHPFCRSVAVIYLK